MKMRYAILIPAILSLALVQCHGGGEWSWAPERIEVTKYLERPCPEPTQNMECQIVTVTTDDTEKDAVLNLIPSSVALLGTLKMADLVNSNLFNQMKKGPSVPLETQLFLIPSLVTDKESHDELCAKGWPDDNKAVSKNIIENANNVFKKISLDIETFAPELMNATTFVSLGLKASEEDPMNPFGGEFVLVAAGNYNADHIVKAKELFEKVFLNGEKADWQSETYGDITLEATVIKDENGADVATYKVGTFGDRFVVIGNAETVGESMSLYKGTGEVKPVTENKGLWDVYTSMPHYAFKFAFYEKVPEDKKQELSNEINEQGWNIIFDKLDAPSHIAYGAGLNFANPAGIIHLQFHVYNTKVPDISLSIALGDTLGNKLKWSNIGALAYSILKYSEELK